LEGSRFDPHRTMADRYSLALQAMPLQAQFVDPKIFLGRDF
jgi:hypothetical protein